MEFSFSALNLVCYEVNNVTITMNGGHTFSKSELGWHNRSLHLGKTVVICEGNMEVLHLYVCNLWSMAKSRKLDRFFNLCLLLDSVCCMPLCWIALVPCFYSYLPKPSSLPSLMVPLGFSFRHRWWHLASRELTSEVGPCGLHVFQCFFSPFVFSFLGFQFEFSFIFLLFKIVTYNIINEKIIAIID